MLHLRSIILITTLSFLSEFAWSQGVKFFEYIPEAAARSASVDRTLQSIKKRQHLVDTKLGRVDNAAFRGDWISIVLPDGKEIQINRTSGSSNSARDFSWIGVVRKGGGEAIFTMTDGILIGNIRLPLATYTIEPLGEGLYYVSRVAREMIPPPDRDNGPVHEPKSQSFPAPRSEQATSSTATANSPVVRILVAYTPASTSYFNGATATGAANQAIVTLNQAFTNSNVNVQAELAGTVSVTYTETGNFENDLASLRVHPTLTTTRNAVAADVVIILFSRLTTGDSLCGLAYRKPSSEYSYGIVVAQWLNAAGDCFAHEVGHIFGADHNTANATGSPFSYGHGYQYTSPVISPNIIGPIGCFRTIMAYDFTCPQGGLSVRNNFSNPSIYIPYINANGVLLANIPSGNAIYANNARVLSEQGATVAAFRGSSSTPGSPGSPQAGAATIGITSYILSD
jgi:hypothetical protein